MAWKYRRGASVIVVGAGMGDFGPRSPFTRALEQIFDIGQPDMESRRPIFMFACLFDKRSESSDIERMFARVCR